MNVSQFFSILLARKWIALAVLLCTVAAATVVSLLLPKQYLGVATVLIDAKPDPIAGALFPERSAPLYVATQMDILRSARVAQRVVRNLKLTESPAAREQWLESTGGEGSIETWLIESFQRNLEIIPSKDSNVITVNYRAGDPKFAADLANAFVQAYLQTAVELRVDPARQFSGFFEARTKEARDQLEAAKAKLSSFYSDRGIVASDERLDIENARLAELSSQLVALQSATAESGSRATQATGASSDRIQEVLNNSLINSLKADLAQTQGRLEGLNARLGDSHPEVIAARASIAELRSRIDAETRRVAGGVSVSATISRQREGEIRAALEAQRTKLLKLKQVRDEGAVLMRDVESAQRSYDTLLTRLTQASMESQANQSNAYMLTQAVPPSKPASPNVVLNIALSVFLGALLALGVALLLEMIDRRVRSPLDLVDGLGLPMLGVMPKPTARRLVGRPVASLMHQRVLGQLPAAGKGA